MSVKVPCDVQSDGVPCPLPATQFLVIRPSARMYQGQEPSPRCDGCGEYARMIFTESLVSGWDLVPFTSVEGRKLLKAHRLAGQPVTSEEGEE